MKKDIIFFILIFAVHNFNICSVVKEYYPILVAVIMIKDEELVIEATLQKLVDGGIDSFFVFDTGSADETVTITKEFFIKNNITCGYIEQEFFIDFATSRNNALDRAQKLFPDAAFMIMLDAEWYLNDVQGLLDFCKLCLTRGDMYGAYLIRICNEEIDFYVPRLIRSNNYNVRFEGPIHETITCQTRVKVPSNVYFEYLPIASGLEKTKNRYAHDKELLYKEYIKNPSNARVLFYLAITCEVLGDLEEAYGFYKKRIEITSFDEEDFISCYRLATTIEKLTKYNKNYVWKEAEEYYLQAYNMRLYRIEPLICLIQHYLEEGEQEKAIIFAQKALAVPYPSEDLLFIEKSVYNCLRYQLFQQCTAKRGIL